MIARGQGFAKLEDKREDGGILNYLDGIGYLADEGIIRNEKKEHR